MVPSVGRGRTGWRCVRLLTARQCNASPPP